MRFIASSQMYASFSSILGMGIAAWFFGCQIFHAPNEYWNQKSLKLLSSSYLKPTTSNAIVLFRKKEVLVYICIRLTIILVTSCKQNSQPLPYKIKTANTCYHLHVNNSFKGFLLVVCCSWIYCAPVHFHFLSSPPLMRRCPLAP